ncbi:MAG: hypothetical protein L6R42_009412, partial [Xanthoria sp. 1 TBL-2021]
MLPSEHEGGEVVVRLGKEKRTLSNPESNEFSYAFLAYGTLDKARPPSVLEDRNSLIDSALTSWKKLLEDDDEASEELVYLFDHQYSEANFGLDFLKGEDQVGSLPLHDACRKHGFSMFLAHFEHSERSKDDSDDDEDEDDESDEWTLTKLFTPDGVCIGEHTEVEKQAIIQDNPFEGDSPDHEESEGWLGNEEATCTEFYRRSCLVIVPEQKYSSFLNRASSLKTDAWTNALLRRMDDSTQAEAARRELLQVCSLTTSKGISAYGGYESLLSVALELDMPSLLISAMEKSPCGLDVEALRKLAQAMASRDVSPWLQVYVSVKLLGVPLSDLFSVSTSISAISRLGLRLGAIKIFDDEYDKAVALHEKPDMTLEKRKYKAAEIARCVSEALVREPRDGALQIGDGDHRFLLLKARSQGDNFLLDVVLPICKNMDFVASTVLQLSEIKNSRTSRSTVSVFARDIITVLAQEMSDHCASKSAKESKTDHFQPRTTGISAYSMHTASETSYDSDLYKTTMSWKAIIKLFCLCEMLEIVDCVPLLTQPLIQIAHASGMKEFSQFLIPLLKSLASELPEVSDSLSHYQNLFQQVLHYYIKDHVGEKPSPPENLVRDGNRDKCYVSRNFYINPTEWYDCKECTALNDFLAAPDRSEWRYRAAEPGRKHLDRRLHKLDCISFTDKSQGTPYTLIIRKDDKSYRDALQHWERRCAGARSEFEGIGEEKLRLFP